MTRTLLDDLGANEVENIIPVIDMDFGKYFLRANATPYDMVLFIADKLAWDQPGIPPYDKAVRYALAHSLEAACLAYMEDTMTSGRMLCPHTNWTLAYDWLTQKP